MAKRSYLQQSLTKDINPLPDTVSDEVVIKPTVSEKKSVDVVTVRLLLDARYKIDVLGGGHYEFLGAGAEVKVDKKDVAFLLGIKRQGGCCGSGATRTIFEIV